MASLFEKLKKDPNNTFARNLSADFYKGALVCLIVILIAAPIRLLKVGNTISKVGTAKVIVLDCKTEKHTHYRHRRHGGRRRVTTYTYHVTFKGTYDGSGEEFQGSQKNDSATYNSFTQIADLKEHQMNVYKSDEKGKLFISTASLSTAQKQYQKANRGSLEMTAELVLKIALIIGLFCYGEGAKHERAGRKESFSQNSAANQRLNDAAKIFDRK